MFFEVLALTVPLFLVYYVFIVANYWTIDIQQRRRRQHDNGDNANAAVGFGEWCVEHRAIPTLFRRFFVHPLLINGHLQTLAGSLIRPSTQIHYKRFAVTMTDGELCVIDEALEEDFVPSDDTTMIVILHGLTGNSDSNYLRHAIDHFHRLRPKSFRLMVIHARGAACERVDAHNKSPDDAVTCVKLKKPMMYSAAFTDDLRDVSDHLQRTYPKALKFLIGYSMGANVIVNYLGKSLGQHPYVGVLSICNPYSLVDINEKRMNKYPGLFYSQHLVKGLKEFLIRNSDVMSLQTQFDLQKGLSSRTIHDFDRAVVVHMHKFKSTQDYYEQASSNQYAKNITIPFLSVAAADDPLCLPESVEPAIADCHANSIFAMSSHGGHVAHLEADGPLRITSALDRICIEFIDAVLLWRRQHNVK